MTCFTQSTDFSVNVTKHAFAQEFRRVPPRTAPAAAQPSPSGGTFVLPRALWTLITSFTGHTKYPVKHQSALLCQAHSARRAVSWY